MNLIQRLKFYNNIFTDINKLDLEAAEKGWIPTKIETQSEEKYEFYFFDPLKRSYSPEYRERLYEITKRLETEEAGILGNLFLDFLSFFHRHFDKEYKEARDLIFSNAYIKPITKRVRINLNSPNDKK